MRQAYWLVAWVAWLPGAHATVCDPTNFQGAYGFLLTGDTTIGSGPMPVAAIGQLQLDGSGQVSGVASTSFTGLFLGNPISGTYEAHPDCSVAWSLQDDSGNLQHFRGTMSGNGVRITFQQSDPGGAHDGLMLRTASGCPESSFAGRYGMSLVGKTINVDTGLVSGSMTLKGFVDADGAGNLSFSPDLGSQPLNSGTYRFEDGCFLHLTLELPAGGNESAEMNFRGILGDSGKELLAVQTDPGTTVSLKLTRR